MTDPAIGLSGSVFTLQRTTDPGAPDYFRVALVREQMDLIQTLKLQLNLSCQRHCWATYNGDGVGNITFNAPRSWLAVDVYEPNGVSVLATKMVWLKPVPLQGIPPHNGGFVYRTGQDMDPEVWFENELGAPVATPTVFEVDLRVPSEPVDPLWPTAVRFPVKFRTGFNLELAPDMDPTKVRTQVIDWFNAIGFFTVMRLRTA